MKATLLIASIAMACSAFSMSAAEADTVKIINNPQRVIITEDSVGTRIRVEGQGDSKDYQYNYNIKQTGQVVKTTQSESNDISFRMPFSKTDSTCSSHWSIVSQYLMVGWGNMNFASGYEDYDPMFSYSTEFGIDGLISLCYETHKGQSISLGFGLHWKNYYFKKKHYMLDMQDHNFVVNALPDSLKGKQANINIMSLTFPLMFSQSLGRNWRISAGAELNLNVYGNLTNRYRYNNKTTTDQIKDIHQRVATVDILGMIGWDAIGAYVRYCPMSVFQSGHGPKASSWFAGLVIGF